MDDNETQTTFPIYEYAKLANSDSAKKKQSASSATSNLAPPPAPKLSIPHVNNTNSLASRLELVLKNKNNNTMLSNNNNGDNNNTTNRSLSMASTNSYSNPNIDVDPWNDNNNHNNNNTRRQPISHSQPPLPQHSNPINTSYYGSFGQVHQQQRMNNNNNNNNNSSAMMMNNNNFANEHYNSSPSTSTASLQQFSSSSTQQQQPQQPLSHAQQLQLRLDAEKERKKFGDSQQQRMNNNNNNNNSYYYSAMMTSNNNKFANEYYNPSPSTSTASLQHFSSSSTQWRGAASQNDNNNNRSFNAADEILQLRRYQAGLEATIEAQNLQLQTLRYQSANTPNDQVRASGLSQSNEQEQQQQRQQQQQPKKFVASAVPPNPNARGPYNNNNLLSKNKAPSSSPTIYLQPQINFPSANRQQQATTNNNDINNDINKTADRSESKPSSTLSMNPPGGIPLQDLNKTGVQKIYEALKLTHNHLLAEFNVLVHKTTDKVAGLPSSRFELEKKHSDFLDAAAEDKAQSTNKAGLYPAGLHSEEREMWTFLKRLMVNTGMIDGAQVNWKEVVSSLITLIKHGQQLSKDLETPVVTVKVGCDQINRKLNSFTELPRHLSNPDAMSKELKFLLLAAVLPEIVIFDPVYAGENLVAPALSLGQKKSSQQKNLGYALYCKKCASGAPLSPGKWKFRRLFGDDEASILVYKSYFCSACRSAEDGVTKSNRNNQSRNKKTKKKNKNADDDDEDDDDQSQYPSDDDVDVAGEDGDDDGIGDGDAKSKNDGADDFYSNVGYPKEDKSDDKLDEKTRKEVLERNTKNGEFEQTMNSAGSWMKVFFDCRFTSKYAVREKLLNDLLQTVNSRSNVHEYTAALRKRYGETHLKRVTQMLYFIASWRSRLFRKGFTEQQWLDAVSSFTASGEALREGGNFRHDEAHAKACRLLRAPLIPAPSYSFLRSSVLEPELAELHKPLQRCMELISRRKTVSVDATYRVPGVTSDGHSGINSMYLAMNEIAMVLSCILAPSDHNENLRKWLKDINVHNQIDTIYTDKCCTDAAIFSECIKRNVKVRLDLFHFQRRWANGLNPRYRFPHRVIIKSLCDAVKFPVAGSPNRITIPDKEQCARRVNEALEELKKIDVCRPVIESQRFREIFVNQMSHIEHGCLEDPYPVDQMYFPHVSGKASDETTCRGTNWNERLHSFGNSKAISSAPQHPETSCNNLLLIFTEHNYNRSVSYNGDVKIDRVNPRNLHRARNAWSELFAPTSSSRHSHLTVRETEMGRHEKEGNPFATKYFDVWSYATKQTMFTEYLEAANQSSAPRASNTQPVPRWCRVTTYQDAVSRLFDRSSFRSTVRIVLPDPDVLPRRGVQVGRRLFPLHFRPNEFDYGEAAPVTDGFAELNTIHDCISHQPARSCLLQPQKAPRHCFPSYVENSSLSMMRTLYVHAASAVFISIVNLAFEDQAQIIPPLFSPDDFEPPPGDAESWARCIGRSYLESTRKTQLNDLDNIVAEFLQQASDITTNVIVLLRTGSQIRSPGFGSQDLLTQTYPPFEKDVPIFIPRRNLVPYLSDVEVDKQLRGIILVHCNHYQAQSFSLSVLGPRLPLHGPSQLPLHLSHHSSTQLRSVSTNAFTDPSIEGEEQDATARLLQMASGAAATSTTRVGKTKLSGSTITDVKVLSRDNLSRVASALKRWRQLKKDKNSTVNDKSLTACLVSVDLQKIQVGASSVAVCYPAEGYVLVDWCEKATKRLKEYFGQQSVAAPSTLDVDTANVNGFGDYDDGLFGFISTSAEREINLLNSLDSNDGASSVAQNADGAATAMKPVPNPSSSLAMRLQNVLDNGKKNSSKDDDNNDDEDVPPAAPPKNKKSPSKTKVTKKQSPLKNKNKK